MPTTRTCARDEMLAAVKAVADDLIDTVTGDPVPVIYDDVPDEIEKADPPIAWVRATVAHQTGNQATLAGSSGVRRYTRTGLLTVQIFTPTGDGLSVADEYATAFQSALQGKSTPNGVWFRDVTAQEAGIDGPWFQTNVVGTFEYDEVT